jgi:BED zinc finger
MGRKKSSVVWDHFRIKTVMKGNKKVEVATCNVCQMDTKFSRNTTNQLFHLRTHHPDVYKLAEPDIQKPPKKSKNNLNSTQTGLLDDIDEEENMSNGIV